MAGTPVPSNSGAATWNSCSGQIRVLLRQCIPFPRGFFRTVYTANIFSLCFPRKLITGWNIFFVRVHALTFYFFFNWRIIALQYYVGFCHLSTWIRHRWTYVPSVLNLCLTSHSTPPLQVDRGHWFELPESYGKSALAVTLRMVTCMFPCHPLHPPHPLLPHCVHSSVLHVCFSIASLQTGSSLRDKWIKKCGTYIQWNITHPQKGTHLSQFSWRRWTYSLLHRVK